MIGGLPAAAAAIALTCISALSARVEAPAKGTCRFEPVANEATAVPERYRLAAQLSSSHCRRASNCDIAA